MKKTSTVNYAFSFPNINLKTYIQYDRKMAIKASDYGCICPLQFCRCKCLCVCVGQSSTLPSSSGWYTQLARPDLWIIEARRTEREREREREGGREGSSSISLLFCNNQLLRVRPLPFPFPPSLPLNQKSMHRHTRRPICLNKWLNAGTAACHIRPALTVCVCTWIRFLRQFRWHLTRFSFKSWMSSCDLKQLSQGLIQKWW